MNLSKNIIQQIQNESLKPRSKWIFVLQHISVWILFVLIILVGSISISFIFFEISLPEQVAARMKGGKLFALSFVLLPSIWIVLTAIFTYIAGRVFQQTEAGYKIEKKYITSGLLLLSIIGGSLFYLTSFTEVFHEILQKNPKYNSIRTNMENKVLGAENGAIFGYILYENEKYFVADRKGEKKWKLHFECHNCEQKIPTNSKHPHIVF